MKFYVDTCIWLNLFKKEGDATKGTPYWKIAGDFLYRVLRSEHDEIVHSDIVQREIEIKLKEEYHKAGRFFSEESKCVKVYSTEEDNAIARQLESHYQFEISFYDILHILLCRRFGCILVTRDKQLLNIARENGIRAYRPEEL